jgi:hypothetical protein
MKSSKTHRIATVLAAIVALAAVTSVAQAATSKPAGMSKAEYRALVIRSDALNQKYGLGDWKGVPQGMTSALRDSPTASMPNLLALYGERKGVAMRPPIEAMKTIVPSLIRQPGMA